MNNNDELQMQVSPICNKNGEKLAYVTFSDSVRRAEGEIPKCIINSNTGFSEEEKKCIRRLYETKSRDAEGFSKGKQSYKVFYEIIGKSNGIIKATLIFVILP